ncbi:MAG: hypothetical protein ACPGN3_04155 [Opitutales bacterium]
MRSVLPLLVLMVLPAALRAGIEIQDVSFSELRSKSILMAVELKAGRESGSRDKYISDIKVAVYASWGDRGQTDPASLKFYRSAAEIVAIEVNDTVTVPFILSGAVADRDELRKDPFGYYIEVQVGGEAVPFSPEFVSPSIRDNASAIRSIKQRAEGEDGKANDGLFVPFYLATYGLENASIRSLPFFRRSEIESIFE